MAEIGRINEFDKEAADFARYAEPTIDTFYNNRYGKVSKQNPVY